MKTFNFKNIEERKALFKFVDHYKGECKIHLNNTVTCDKVIIAIINF